MKLGYPRNAGSLYALIHLVALFHLVALCETAPAIDDVSDAEATWNSGDGEAALVGRDPPYRSVLHFEMPVDGQVETEILEQESTVDLAPPTQELDSHATVLIDESADWTGLEEPINTLVELPPAVMAIECERDQEEDSVGFGDWLGYNSAQSSTSWLAGNQMGMFSIESYPSLKVGSDAALVVGTGFHFLNGPKATDMPPRLFDFVVGYHARRAISEDDFLDVKFGVGAFSDFEGSARKGVRYPGHFVSYHRWEPNFVSVFGVDVLDRDDISALPVGGVVVRCMDDVLLELVFPRPRAQLRVSDEKAMYVAGELGGGTWAIERMDRRNDNATYRDLRIAFGVTQFGKASESVLEFGIAFDRSLEYRSTIGNRDLDSTFMLRSHVLY